MKALVGGSDDRILGFTMIGAEAGEVMAAVQTAMLAGLPYTKLRDAVLAHPTMAEGLDPLLSNVPARSATAGHAEERGVDGLRAGFHRHLVASLASGPGGTRASRVRRVGARH